MEKYLSFTLREPKYSMTAMVFDRRGRLLSIGKNSYIKTHTLQAKAGAAVGNPNRIFLHAEIAALTKLKDWDKAHRIVITRYTKEGKPACAKPCPACMWVIRQTGIKEIEHT
jgi:tRNA(Arg) A34 adenosine deaminase TadA